MVRRYAVVVHLTGHGDVGHGGWTVHGKTHVGVADKLQWTSKRASLQGGVDVGVGQGVEETASVVRVRRRWLHRQHALGTQFRLHVVLLVFAEFAEVRHHRTRLRQVQWRLAGRRDKYGVVRRRRRGAVGRPRRHLVAAWRSSVDRWGRTDAVRGGQRVVAG